jgi:Carboxypeptidase regulatory-like domain/TonB dependent receptor-like, beta-barrel
MRRNLCLVMVASCLFLARATAQTINGLITGTITDTSGAVVPGAKVQVINLGTSATRSAETDTTGSYIIPQLPPGLYSISVKKEGFATQTRSNVQLTVNQSLTIDFKLTVSAARQTVEVTGAPPLLNTTSATLRDVVQHQAIVDLPLNGQQFTQLALLTPGAAPVQNNQQGGFTVAEGVGSISPSVNGQRGEENNYTMDGLLNNQLFMNTVLISPSPAALQEFNVQSHITDAQFAISSGANINVVTRSGTNQFHGSIWEFARNSAFDARNFFESNRLPYNQHQYGVYFGGPVILPHFNGKDNTWFSAFWQGFRASQTLTYFADTFTAAERQGDFSALLGPQVGTDSLGRPEYQSEIYDPATSRPDPNNPAVSLRDPFDGNIIPTDRINPASALYLKTFYPLPNLNVPATVFPNLQFSGTTATKADVVGVRIDHHFGKGDTLFGKYNRSNANLTKPGGLPTNPNDLLNYGEVAGLGYTHLFGTSTVLNLHYGWENMNLITRYAPAGMAFTTAINSTPLVGNPLYPPSVSIANAYSGVTQLDFPLGPQRSSEVTADLTKVIGHHTLGAGAMFYRITGSDNAWDISLNFTQNATSQDATPGPTGLGPASFLLGLPDSSGGYAGNSFEEISANWYGAYLQDVWKAARNLTITAGLRYDFVAPINPHRIVTGLDFYTGAFIVNQAIPPLFPTATAPSNWYYPQYNGFEPRFGIAYRVSNRTVLRAAFAILDDHNNEVVQESTSLRFTWPEASSATLTLQNRGLPNLFLNNLPPASSFMNLLVPVANQDSDPHSPIAYSEEWNFGIEQQLPSSMVLTLGYVGSYSGNQWQQTTANGARIPGPGPLASRGQAYPQWSPITWGTNDGAASYNAFQAELKKTLSPSLFFTASYTWSKSLDNVSDPYTGNSGSQNFYNTRADWGPSDYNLGQLFVLSSVYALPVGKDSYFLSSSHGIVQALAGNWNVGGILSLHSGLPFSCLAGRDVANVGAGVQRCDIIGNAYGGAGFQQARTQWLNPASFTTIPFTWGTESRNGLTGPSYKVIDFSVFKNFQLFKEGAQLQVRGDFFNIFNHTNFQNPTSNIQSGAFGRILGSNFAREIQLAAKVTF